MSVSPKKN